MDGSAAKPIPAKWRLSLLGLKGSLEFLMDNSIDEDSAIPDAVIEAIAELHGAITQSFTS